ncbi:MAG: DNA-binding protein [Proteobacteria bacterium]|nr:DNA-binding protein [Pseudomonadota bacterium]
MLRRVRGKEVLMGRLQRGDDLLEALTAVVTREGVRLARVEALGAVEKARVGYYDQASFEYRYLDLDRDLEILTLVGNVSLRDGQPVVHAHLTLGDGEGRAFGGHLAAGTRVFACEFAIEVLDGGEFHRGHDEATGLPLWTG